MSPTDLEQSILRMVERVSEDERRIGVYSTGEQLAVALVLDRKDLLLPAYDTMLEACNRLGQDWFEAALNVQRRLPASMLKGHKGMEWWNGLTGDERKRWAEKAENTGVAADAWELYKRLKS